MQEFFQNLTDGKLFLVMLPGISLQLNYAFNFNCTCVFVSNSALLMVI